MARHILKISKYQSWYDQLIERARLRQLDCYSERHHVIPRSLGGTDEDNNLVQLTYREHFLAHWLLTKLYTGRGRRSMVYALVCMGTMSPSSQRIIAGWQYEVAKRAVKDNFTEFRETTVRLRKENKRRIKLDTMLKQQQKVDNDKYVFMQVKNDFIDKKNGVVIKKTVRHKGKRIHRFYLVPYSEMLNGVSSLRGEGSKSLLKEAVNVFLKPLDPVRDAALIATYVRPPRIGRFRPGQLTNNQLEKSKKELAELRARNREILLRNQVEYQARQPISKLN